jgi:hypothetical protein
MIVIHIGASKAGSSSIQAFLSANEESLRQFSVEYSSIGRAERNSHQNIAHELKNARRGKFERDGGTLEEVVARWAKGNSRTLVISSERFEQCNPHEIRQLRRAFAGLGEKFRILYVIRDLLELLPSIFDQQCRHGFTSQRFDEFFEKIMRHPRTDFFATAERWADVFGWHAMHVRALDPRNLVNGSLLEEIVATLQIEEGDLRLMRTKSRNVSTGWKSLVAVQALVENRHGLPDAHPLLAIPRPDDQDTPLGRLALRAAARHGWNKEKGRYFTREQAIQCWEKFHATVEKLNMQTREQIPLPLSLDERKFVEREFEPDVRHIPTDELRTFYDEMWRVSKKSKHTSGRLSNR